VNTKLDTGLQIGTVAVRSGLTVDTIRFYEKQGLVAKPHRSPEVIAYTARVTLIAWIS
jgi:DNA-binding transcriptional MerR regulator